MSRRVYSLLLFLTGLFAFLGFILHMAYFKSPPDLAFLFHRAALSTTVILTVFCGVCLFMNLDKSDQVRFETRLLFAALFSLLVLFLLGTFLAVLIIWVLGVEDDDDGEDTYLKDDENAVLSAVLTLGIVAMASLIFVLASTCMTVYRNWGSIPEDE